MGREKLTLLSSTAVVTSPHAASATAVPKVKIDRTILLKACLLRLTTGCDENTRGTDSARLAAGRRPSYAPTSPEQSDGCRASVVQEQKRAAECLEILRSRVKWKWHHKAATQLFHAHSEKKLLRLGRSGKGHSRDSRLLLEKSDALGVLRISLRETVCGSCSNSQSSQRRTPMRSPCVGAATPRDLQTSGRDRTRSLTARVGVRPSRRRHCVAAN